MNDIEKVLDKLDKIAEVLNYVSNTVNDGGLEEILKMTANEVVILKYSKCLKKDDD